MRLNGGSLSTSCGAKTIDSRTRLSIRHSPSRSSKNRSRRASFTPAIAPLQYAPRRAMSSACGLASVANSLIVSGFSAASAASHSSIASEYASSPVLHAGTHARTSCRGSALATSGSITFSRSDSHAGGSRKNSVTWISKSRESWSTSSASPRSTST